MAPKKKGKASKKKQLQLQLALEAGIEVEKLKRLRELYPKRCNVFASTPFKDIKIILDKAISAWGNDELPVTQKKIHKVNFSAF
jgi:hypothetical protein